MIPRSALADARRVVIKIGSNVVADPRAGGAGGIALGRVHGLVEALARLHGRGLQLLVVSSGAVAMGRITLGLRDRPASLGLRQACAAVGQGQLIALYTQAFGLMGVRVAQVLLTQEDLGDRDHLLCLRTTLMRLLELSIVPILNENDSVSVRELVEHGGGGALVFGDNDGLSARLALAIDADLLVLLTDVDGLYTANPSEDPAATRIPSLTTIDPATLAMTAGTSSAGTGGMASKLGAAAYASERGLPVLIARGDGDTLERALAGDDLGTLISGVSPALGGGGEAGSGRRSAHRRAIAVTERTRGGLILNDGALTALRERKASLLPIGVVAVDGDFACGDLVELRDGQGRVHGRGLVNYGGRECRAIAGHHSSEIDRILGWRGYDEVITRDNLVMAAY